jgi:diguanylate cyclase (GGDEF)-like protein/PAS domain S-box-containing protein
VGAGHAERRRLVGQVADEAATVRRAPGASQSRVRRWLPRRIAGPLSEGLLASPRPSTRRHYGSAGEFAMLASVEVLIGLFRLLFAVFPPVPGSPRGIDALLGCAFLGLATLTLWIGPKLGDWGLDASIALASVLLALVVSSRLLDVSQALAAASMMLLAVFAAYCRPPRRLWPLVAAMLALYGAALLVNPRTPSALFFVVVAVSVVTAAGLVSILIERLRVQSQLDPLTGALNRRGLADQAGAVAGVAGRSGIPVAVVIMDLDAFKRFNDEHGHVAGDTVLVHLVAHWQAVLREGDVLGRVGGDEFVLVLPGARTADAAELVTRMRAAYDFGWTAGIAEWAPEEDMWAALGRADQELYRRKDARSGVGRGVIRARGVVASGGACVDATDDLLAQAREQLRVVLEGCTAAISRWGVDGRLMYINHAVAPVDGREPEELIGRRAEDAGFPPQMLGQVRSAIERTPIVGEPTTFMTAVDTPDGTRCYATWASPEFGPGAVVASVVLIVTDVTESQRPRPARSDPRPTR